jgi:hypothetical protein
VPLEQRLRDKWRLTISLVQFGGAGSGRRARACYFPACALWHLFSGVARAIEKETAQPHRKWLGHAHSR